MEGHVSRDCTLEAKAKSCYKCGQEGHIVRLLSSSYLGPHSFVASRVTAPRASAAAVATAVVASRLVLARNATAVVKSGTLHARVPTVLPTLGMAAVVAVATGRLAAEARLGTHAAGCSLGLA